MMTLIRDALAGFLLVVFVLAPAASSAADDQAALSPGELNEQVKPSFDGVSVEPSSEGPVVRIKPGGADYPGVELAPASGDAWDWSKFGHVEARLTNTGDKPVTVTVRIDNKGDWRNNPWNGENLSLKPGETKSVKVHFGYSWGKKGFKLDAGAITKLLLFTGKSSDAKSFRIDAITPGGLPGEGPPVDPRHVRIVPPQGVMLGASVDVNPEQIIAKNVNTKLNDDHSIIVHIPANGSEQYVSYKPAVGRWDLRKALQVRLTLRNEGTTPVRPRARVGSDRGSTDTARGEEIAPGERGEIVVSFIPETPWQGIPNSGDRTNWDGVKGTGTRFASDAAGSVIFAVDGASVDQRVVVESITAEVPEPQSMPHWLGQRPPVEGDWSMTFEENFDGEAVDVSKWNYYGANYWDRKSHFSKDNVIVEDGVAKMRFEKRRGHQNDDPQNKKVNDYATGFLDTYGKWVQRYGYFESRMKLPEAPGLWPAFWMMPDRGLDAGPQWKRQDTRGGGMEFDIMEHLTRWGPYRYNIAMHWDGYEKQHKQTGSEAIYFQPDADGYVTAGLLWLPGQLVFYCNGEEVARWEAERVSDVPASLLFTLPCGGWDNSPLDDARLPDDFVIDYVRCWQRADLASDADGPRQPAAGNELGADRS